MLATLLFVLLQTAVIAPTVAQIINYILLIVNTIYTIFIIPTYKEYKAVVEDYKQRNSPKYLEAIKVIKDKEKEEFNEIIKVIKDLKHDVNQLRQDKVNLETVFKEIHDIRNSLNIK
jgi:predicted negative regulator of RcsB-dependent stress response